MAYQTPKTIRDTLEEIAQGRLVLPAIQRELVWANEPERMTRLFDSVLREYPIGTFLFWKVSPELSKQFHFYEFLRDWHERNRRHNERLELAQPRELVAILDGQQRLSALNIGLYGSLAHKLPRKRVDSLGAYPPKRLYLDLRHEADPDDDLLYNFDFLTADQATADDVHHWYRVGDVLELSEPGQAIYEYVTHHDLHGTPAFRTLDRLWNAVHRDGVISYFEEKDQSLTKVLDIFIRVNSGGVVLTKSDLLLSIATAQFTERDAREEVHRLVDELNATKPGFRFSKDLVLKAGLVLTDVSDVGFKVENFTAANLATLDKRWDAVDHALRIGVKLLSSFGFSEASLPAASLLIPIADYIYARGLDETYVASASEGTRTDRAQVRNWAIRTILKPGIWGSSLDGLLRALHQVITTSQGGFPAEALGAEMARRGKSLAVDEDLLEDLLDTQYKHKRTFALLSLLYDWVDTRNDFHVDHVFPRGATTAAKLRDHGVPEADRDEVRDKVERLANLQLLPGPENVQKQATLPADWVASMFPNLQAREAWLVGHDLGGVPVEVTDFLDFYETRRNLMRDRLLELLGATVSDVERMTLSRPAPEPLPDVALIAPLQNAGTVEHRRVSAGPTRRGHKRLYETRLADLVERGVLQPGVRLSARYRGGTYEVRVEPDGRLSSGANYFETPSQAARLLTDQKAVNGWAFWSTDDGTQIGDLRGDW